MPFPKDSRLTTYAPGTVVRSADLNAIQDAIVGASHGEITKVIQPEDMFTDDLTRYVDGTSGPVASVIRLAAASESAHFNLEIPIGAIFDQIVIYGRNPGGPADPVDATLVIGDYTAPVSTGSTTALGSSPTASGAWTISHTFSPVLTRLVNNTYKVKLAATGATFSVDIAAATLRYYMP